MSGFFNSAKRAGYVKIKYCNYCTKEGHTEDKCEEKKRAAADNKNK